MISYRNPWQNAYTIRVVAVIDMTFACLLVTIYIQKLLQPIDYGSASSNQIQRVPSLKLFLLGPISFNAFQIVMGCNLLSAARRRCEPLIAYAKSTTWFQFSVIMLLFLLLKLFLVLWFPPQGSLNRRDIFGVTIIVLEAVFKIFGLFIVKEFIDDLKHVLTIFPLPQYYCIYNPSSTQPVFLPETVTLSAPTSISERNPPLNLNISGSRNISPQFPSYPSSSTATLVQVQDSHPETGTSTYGKNSIAIV